MCFVVILCDDDVCGCGSRSNRVVVGVVVLFIDLGVRKPVAEVCCVHDGLAGGHCGLALDAEGLADGFDDGASSVVVLIILG